MRMTRRMVAIAVAASLGGWPIAGRAQNCRSAPECLSRIFGGRPNAEAALVTGIIAAPVILGGAVAAAAHEALKDKPDPGGVVEAPPEPGQKKPQLKLSLIPNTPPPDPEPLLTPRERATSQHALEVNEALTNAAIAAGGAAVLGGILYGIIKNK